LLIKVYVTIIKCHQPLSHVQFRPLLPFGLPSEFRKYFNAGFLRPQQSRSTVTDDVINQVTHRIFNINWQYCGAFFAFRFYEKNSALSTSFCIRFNDKSEVAYLSECICGFIVSRLASSGYQFTLFCCDHQGGAGNSCGGIHTELLKDEE